MTPEQRDRVEAVFDAALDLAPADRNAFVERECRDDDVVRNEVVALLAAHDRDFGILEAASPTTLAASLLEAYRPGSRIGPYRLIREIGRGGMGVVYLAERDDGQFRRTVAIKVMRAGADPDEVRRRLEAERQILASLDHPNIARLYDGGMGADGRPYLVMEFVEGVPIDEYCNRHRLSIEERLSLFCTVAHAVHYAHRRLVVHRDLKPSNILVTPDGQPKLLDFGIAKILEESPIEEAAPHTRTGLRLLTPEYASPEQIRGGAVTTANDVYALGVVLYELLTGKRPFNVSDLSAAEAERVILWQDAPRPSTILARPASAAAGAAGDTAAAPDPAHVAALRRSTPARLARRLAGDLDNLVLMALRKEPERRYSSAQQFADDIERHLEGRPVVARGDSPAYRARKFVDRHRWGVLAGGAIVVLLAAGIISTLVQARAAAEQARIALEERVRAEQEAQRAARVQSIVVDLFRLSDPNEALGDTITARQMLDRGAERILREFDDQPEVQASLLSEVARVYANLGLTDRAETLVRQSLELRSATFGDSSLEASASLSQLGQVIAAQGRHEEATAPLRAAIAIRERLAPPPDSLLAATRTALAWELRALGNHQEAAALFASALETQRTLLGDASPAVANSILGLASALHDEGRFDEAESLFQQALSNRDAGLDQPHPMAALALLNIGMIRRIREQYVDAVPLLETALRMRRSLYGDEHPLTLEAMSEYGIVLENLGRHDEAARVQRDGLAIATRTLGQEHPRTSSFGEGLAWTLTVLGEYDEATALSNAAIAARRTQFAGDHAQIEYDLINSADALIALGRLDEAERRLDQALAMARRISDTPGVYTMLARWRLALIALERHDLAGAIPAAAVRPGATGSEQLARAERLLAEAAAIGAEQLRPDHRYRLSLARATARLRLRQGRASDAAALLQPIRAAEDTNLPSPHPNRAETLRLLGEASLAAGDPVAAERHLASSLDQLGGLPSDHWLRGETTALLGRAIRDQGRPDEGQTLIDEGLATVEAHLGPASASARRIRAYANPLRPTGD